MAKHHSTDWVRLAGALANTRAALRSRIAPALLELARNCHEPPIQAGLRTAWALVADEAATLTAVLKARAARRREAL